MLYKVMKGIASFLFLFVYRIKSQGKENIPKEGGVIFAVNHRSWVDPFMVALTSPRPLTFMAKAELFKNPIFGKALKALGAFPVKRGKGDLAAVKTALSILKEEKVMMIFPEGTRVKKGQTVEAKPGVAMFAIHAKTPIIPIKIDGEYGFMKRITVIYGEPMDFSEYGKLPTEELKKLSQGVMDKIYSMEADK